MSARTDARAAWNAVRAPLALGVAGAAALVPLFARSQGARADATEVLLLLLAAVGLNVAMGYAGQPSLGQGAFVGIGAYGTAILRAHAGWGPVASVATAVALAILAGWLTARAVANLRPAFVALATWIAAWAFALAVAAFPATTGGASGLVLPEPVIHLRALGLRAVLTPVALYEIALASLVLFALALWAALRRFAPALAAVRGDPAAAAAAGVRVARLRSGALVASAAAGGWAGALLVLSSGVADPTAYGPLLSIKLFLVVLLGGAATFIGPAAGLGVLAAVTAIAGALADATDASSERLEAIAAGVVLIVVLAVARTGIVPLAARVLPRAAAPAPPGAAEFATGGGASLVAEGVGVSYGGVRALDGVDVGVERGTCHAIVGPNGSGKTTLLRVLSGGLRAEGRVRIDEAPLVLGDAAGALRLGVVRTFQRLAVAPEPTALEHVVSGMEAQRDVGWVRAATATPQARAERARAERRGHELLALFDLDAHAAAPASSLSVGEQRLLQLARALAAAPRVLLLDEPSAGLDARDEERLRAALAGIRAAGTTVVLVEHNLALVRAVADTVTVLDAGAVLARGTPEQIAADEAVRAVYLGAG